MSERTHTDLSFHRDYKWTHTDLLDVTICFPGLGVLCLSVSGMSSH